MNAVGKPTDLCAICLGANKKKPSKELPYPCLPGFIRRFLGSGAVITLKPCNHRFHLQCISRWMNKSSQCPFDRCYITGTTPPLLPPVEIDLHQELDKAIENNQIAKVKDILLSGLTPKRRTSLVLKSPLTDAIENHRWEIAGLLQDGTRISSTHWAGCTTTVGGWSKTTPRPWTITHLRPSRDPAWRQECWARCMKKLWG